MKRNMVWKLVAAAFVLNAVGLLWIRNEVVNAGRVGAEGGNEKSLRVVAFEPKERAEKADRLLVVFNEDLVGEDKIGQAVGWTPFQIEPSAEGSGLGNRKNAREFNSNEHLLSLITLLTLRTNLPVAILVHADR